MFCCRSTPLTTEHVLPEWIRKLVDNGLPGRMNLQRRAQAEPRVWLSRDGLTIKRFCRSCNGGWMSDLESDVRALVGPMVRDLTVSLGHADQLAVARWGAKTAMVTEGANDRPWFYTDDERRSVMTGIAPPPRTTVWIGRHAHSDRSFSEGRRLGGRGPIPEAYATTFAIARFVLQVLTFRTLPDLEGKQIRFTAGKPGPWRQMLLEIWPRAPAVVQWPPLRSFSDAGTTLEDLSARFRED